MRPPELSAGGIKRSFVDLPRRGLEGVRRIRSSWQGLGPQEASGSSLATDSMLPGAPETDGTTSPGARREPDLSPDPSTNAASRSDPGSSVRLHGAVWWRRGLFW